MCGVLNAADELQDRPENDLQDRSAVGRSVDELPLGQLYRVRWRMQSLLLAADRARLSEASNIVLIGHGTGCTAVMDLVNQRGESLQQDVKKLTA